MSEIRIHIIEFSDLSDLVKVAEKSLYKIKIGGYWILYQGVSDCDFLGLHVYISKANVPKYLSLDFGTDRVLGGNKPPNEQGFVPIVEVKSDSWVIGAMIKYMLKVGYIKQEENKDGKTNASKKDST